jgi:hypothetical protein
MWFCGAQLGFTMARMQLVALSGLVYRRPYVHFK